MKKFDVYLGDLEPTKGSEINKARPVVIISPDQFNKFSSTVVIAPMTSTIRRWPTRVSTFFNNKNGAIAIDQLRTVDKIRLIKKLGTIEDTDVQDKITEVLMEFFA